MLALALTRSMEHKAEDISVEYKIDFIDRTPSEILKWSKGQWLCQWIQNTRTVHIEK